MTTPKKTTTTEEPTPAPVIPPVIGITRFVQTPIRLTGSVALPITVTCPTCGGVGQKEPRTGIAVYIDILQCRVCRRPYHPDTLKEWHKEPQSISYVVPLSEQNSFMGGHGAPAPEGVPVLPCGHSGTPHDLVTTRTVCTDCKDRLIQTITTVAQLAQAVLCVQQNGFQETDQENGGDH